MLYPKNKAEKLDIKLFENPTAEYRGTPFWAWNTNLKEDELLWQIEKLKEMGFGGYHMHVRSGMNTPYLSEEFMQLIKSCVEKGKAENMLSWLYDEDRWPSGAAGGIVTKDKRFRNKFITFSETANADATDPITGYNEGKPYLLAVYDVVLNGKGELASYKRINESDSADGKKIYAYVNAGKDNGWYNGQAYVDTLDEDAMKKFIDVTYEAYNAKIADDFGKSVPAIFTDEPQFSQIKRMNFSAGDVNAILAWTNSFDSSFKDVKGYYVTDKLPEVIWDLENGAPSKARYDYYDHVTELFAHCFGDQCGEWCDKHDIALTGHLMAESKLEYQTTFVGDAMRSYRGFGLPGVDMLCDSVELTTAKQTQSTVHQYGKEGMLSELYGVTGWAFDFKGHKFQGDWQAALGVTVRVPHLSWVSMKGSAKRDYPASIHYQSAWYNRYAYVEDHFARLNTALTRGCADVKIGVIHPIESQWLNMGPSDTSSDSIGTLENCFQNLTRYLLSSSLDFDFISEGILPDLNGGIENGALKVGKMAYSAVVVPPIRTIRSTTVSALSDLIDNGGLVLFVGECPECVDGAVSDGAKELYEKAKKCPFTMIDIANALESVRDVTMKNENGDSASNFLYSMRCDGDGKWLFITRFIKPGVSQFYDPATNHPTTLTIKVKGNFKPTVYNTVTGKTEEISFVAKDGCTTFKKVLYASDSLLVRLDNAEECNLSLSNTYNKKLVKSYDIKEKLNYSLGEPNVMVLDMPAFSKDGEVFGEREEMLRIDAKLRREFGWPNASGGDCQPWVIGPEKIDTFVYLKFEFESEIEAPCKLAFEEAESVTFNGVNVPVCRDGYFTDKEIYTMNLPSLKVGKNTLTVKAPISKRVSLENMFLLGDFGVVTDGTESRIVKRASKLAFGNVVNQGLPFYGSTISYEIPVTVENTSDIKITSSYFGGSVIGVSLDGVDMGNIAYAPFSMILSDVTPGEHKITMTLYASRVNCFGALHACVDLSWKGPNMYFTKGTEWSYEYNLTPVGILKSPTIEIYE